MGVPKFYRWLSERYPLINQLLSTAAVLPEFDNFYLDMNGIIHACTHPNSDFLANSLSVREMMLSIFRYVDRMVTEIVKPKKILFLAIDGVAPRAKLNQQRARRFCSAEGRTDAINQAKARGEAVDEDALFDSNCITPGTEFMDTVSRHLKYFIRKKIKEDPLWRNLTIVFSGHDVPGEGEHKIMQFIRDLRADPHYEPNVRHCMYGQDADLIMLGLATHEPHFALLREVINFNVGGPKRSARQVVLRQSKDAQFQLLHISLLREYIVLDFAHDLKDAPEPDVERLVDDFVFLTFLVGNDFLPHLPTLDIGEHAFDVLIDALRRLYQERPGYLVHKGEIADLPRFEALCQLIGQQEQRVLTDRESDAKDFNARRRKHDAELPSEEELAEGEEEMQRNFDAALREAMGLPPRENKDESEAEGEDALRGEEEKREGDGEGDEEKKTSSPSAPPEKDYRGRYYFDKFRVIASSAEGEVFLTNLMRHYLQGLQWCLAYYVKGCVSWTWYYPFHYGPMLQDMRGLDALQSEISFSLGQPFTPFQQLLGCLPPASARLLPPCYRFLMTSKDSPVIAFYPLTFRVDQDGKKNPWEAVVLLDFIPEDALLCAESEHCPASKLTRSEVARNLFGKIQVYEFDPAASATFLSCNPEIGLPDIARCQSTLEELPFSLAPGHYFVPELVPGTRLPIAGFPSLAMLPLERVSLSDLKINVFGSASRYKSLSLSVSSAPVALSAEQAALLLNRVVYVNFPHVHEARVVAVLTESDELRLGGDLEDPAYVPQVVRVQRDARMTEAAQKDAAAEQSKFSVGRAVPGTGGLDVGPITARLCVRPLQGLQRDPVTGATRKVYARALETEIPIQLALWRPPVQDPRFEESAALPVERLMPVGTTVVALASRLVGCKGRVIGPHKSLDASDSRSSQSLQAKPQTAPRRRTVDVEFSIPPPEPPFGYALAAAVADQYVSARDLCSLLRVSPSVLGKVVGSVRVEPGRGDLGLNLKKNGEYQLLGYVRRVDGASASRNGAPPQRRGVWQGVDTVQIVGMTRDTSAPPQVQVETTYWEYSAHAAALLCEYKARFPILFSQLESLPHEPVYNVNALLGENAKSNALAIMDWMKEQPFFSLPRTHFSTVSLSREAMCAIERAEDVHSSLCASKGFVTKVVRGVAIDKLFCALHRTQHDVPLTHNKLEPRLGDRVVNLASVGVPLGLRGTVVTIHQATKYVEVIFDEEFTSGKSLQGNCSQFRGKLCAWADLLLVSGEDALRENLSISESPAAAELVAPPQDRGASKGKQLLSLLKRDAAPPAHAVPLPAAPARAAAAPFAQEQIAETISATTVSIEHYVSPIVAPDVAAAAMRSALARKRDRLAAALQRVQDEPETEGEGESQLARDAKHIEALVEAAKAMDVSAREDKTPEPAQPAPSPSVPSVQPAEATESVAVAAVQEVAVVAEPAVPESRKVSGRLLLAAAAGVEARGEGEKAALLLPPPGSALAHCPWMGVVSYDTHRAAPPAPPVAADKPRVAVNREAAQRVVRHELGVRAAAPFAADKPPAKPAKQSACVYFAQYGNCTKGSECKFSHAVAPVAAAKPVPAPPSKSLAACNYYKHGRCLKGDKCNFAHEPVAGRAAPMSRERVEDMLAEAKQRMVVRRPAAAAPAESAAVAAPSGERERKGEEEPVEVAVDAPPAEAVPAPIEVVEAEEETAAVASTSSPVTVEQKVEQKPQKKSKTISLLANAKKALKEKQGHVANA